MPLNGNFCKKSLKIASHWKMLKFSSFRNLQFGNEALGF